MTPGKTSSLPFRRHAVDPTVVLRTHVSSTGPSPGRYMTSLGPWITVTGIPTEMSDAVKLGIVCSTYV